MKKQTFRLLIFVKIKTYQRDFSKLNTPRITVQTIFLLTDFDGGIVNRIVAVAHI